MPQHQIIIGKSISECS